MSAGATPVRHRWRAVATTSAWLLGLLLLVVGLVGLLAERGKPDATSGPGAPGPSADFDVRLPPTNDHGATTISHAPPATDPTDTTPRPVPTPLAVRVPSVGIGSELIRLGLNPDHTLEVPRDFGQAGWYVGRPVPGEPGPSIIVGHVDSRSGPAVFYRLDEVGPGATVDVPRSDGTTARFVVVAKEQHDKDAFPTERVYGPTDSPELRLITCGGAFDRSIGHYTDNVIVFAELVEILPSA